MTDKTPVHFSQKQRRKAEFFMPPNVLKDKVGNGGLNLDIINKAQSLIDQNKYDYKPEGEAHLVAMMAAITEAHRPNRKAQEDMIFSLLFPAMLLKTGGGMFHYQLVTKVADRLVQFLGVIERLDAQSLEIIEGFYTTLRAIFVAQLKGEGGPQGQDLYQALLDACTRYFEKNPLKPNSASF